MALIDPYKTKKQEQKQNISCCYKTIYHKESVVTELAY